MFSSCVITALCVSLAHRRRRGSNSRSRWRPIRLAICRPTSVFSTLPVKPVELKPNAYRFTSTPECPAVDHPTCALLEICDAHQLHREPHNERKPHRIRQNPVRAIRIRPMRPQDVQLLLRDVRDAQSLDIHLLPQPLARDVGIRSDLRAEPGRRMFRVQEGVGVPVFRASTQRAAKRGKRQRTRRIRGRRLRVVDLAPDRPSRDPTR